MTATAFPLAPEPVTGRSKVGLRVAVAALMVGVIVAVLGVKAAFSSYQREQYAQARSTAQYFVKNGNTISISMQRLQVLNDQDRSLMKNTRAALDARDASRFNTLADQANARNTEQQSLHNQVKSFQVGFDKNSER